MKKNSPFSLLEETECPQCGAQWTLEEIEWQQCDACGYPDEDEAFDDDFDDDEN
jgi:Zn ribbon nucleic-acid-binding protein